jgi:hypothetical protein
MENVVLYEPISQFLETIELAHEQGLALVNKTN